MTEWQPIETAPKPVYNEETWENGQEAFLVWDGTQVWCVDPVLYPHTNGCGCCAYQVEATHWMALPKPPVTLEKTND
jgi:hypothetical protein